MPKQDIKKLERREEERQAAEGGAEEKAKWGKAKEKPKAIQKAVKAGNIIRLAETNIDASKPVRDSIRAIRGISFMLANAISNVTGLNSKRIADLTEDEKKKLEDVIYNPGKYSIPVWMFNRRNEPATGRDMHIIASQLQLTRQMDINEMKKLKSYKGVRHSLGLPVRGQRTRNTGRTKGGAVGVRKKKEMPARAEGAR